MKQINPQAKTIEDLFRELLNTIEKVSSMEEMLDGLDLYMLMQSQANSMLLKALSGLDGKGVARLLKKANLNMEGLQLVVLLFKVTSSMLDNRNNIQFTDFGIVKDNILHRVKKYAAMGKTSYDNEPFKELWNNLIKSNSVEDLMKGVMFFLYAQGRVNIMLLDHIRNLNENDADVLTKGEGGNLASVLLVTVLHGILVDLACSWNNLAIDDIDILKYQVLACAETAVTACKLDA